MSLPPRIGQGLAILLISALLPTLGSSAGLDPGFGVGGWVREAVGFGNNPAFDGAVQADGKLLIVGTWGFQCALHDDEREPVVARYEPDGTLDSSFGINGISRLQTPVLNANAYAVAEAADGKIVVGGGVTYGSVDDLLVMRLAADGGLDPSFGAGNGYATFDAGGGEVAQSVVAHPDGRISAVGFDWFSDTVLVVRFAADGGLDTSFGGGAGFVTTQINIGDDVAWDAALQPDGKLVVVGRTESDGFVARYLEDGSLDAGFASGGVAVTDFGGSDTIHGLALQDDGKIVVTGTNLNAGGTTSDGFVARYGTSGALDTGFGSGGLVGFGGSIFDRGLAVHVQSDGRIIVASSLTVMPGYREIMGALRFEANGTPDTSFGSNGLVIPSVDEVQSIPSAIAALDDDGMVLMGRGDSFNYEAFVAARLDGTGAPELAFGEQGVATTRVRGTDDYGTDVAALPDGRILSAVTSELSESCLTFVNEPKIGVVAHLPDGSLDPDFGQGGIASFSVRPDPGGAEAVAVQPDGKIILAGTGANTSFDDFLAVRLLPDGSLDPDFGTDGFAYVAIPLQTEEAFSVELQPDGKIVVAGTIYTTGDTDIGLARLNANGALDPSFGTAGVVISDVANQDDYATDLALQPDGKLVVGGTTDQSFLLLRYNPDGSLDGTFGSGGTLTPSLAFGAETLGAVLVDVDGNVVMVGDAQDPGPTGRRGVVLRRSPDGTPDLGFGQSGVLAPEAWRGLRFRDAAILPNHRIVIAGSRVVSPDLAFISVLHEGIPDTSHAPDGVAFFDLGGADFAEAITVLDGGDRVALVGRIEDQDGVDFVVAAALSPLPEPAPVLMLAVGATALALLGRRRNRRGQRL